MDINLIVNVTSRAWSLSILSLMHEGVVGKPAPLIAASGAGRTAFTQSLNHLIELELLARNPGHGHPLRPEFILTEKGIELAAMAHRIQPLAARDSNSLLLRKAWTLPVLAVSREPKFFSQIKRDLGSITDRALSQSLKHLQSHNWIERHVVAEMHPPRAHYRVINEGAEICHHVGWSG